MITAVFLTLLGSAAVAGLFIGYRRLISCANARFDAWENVLDQQHALLTMTADFLARIGRRLPKETRSPLIASAKRLMSTDENDIAAVGLAQQTLVMTLLDALEDDLPTEDRPVDDFDGWLACQDNLVLALDDLYLAQRYYNDATTRYNAWRSHVWLYWLAEALRYHAYPTVTPLKDELPEDAEWSPFETER